MPGDGAPEELDACDESFDIPEKNTTDENVDALLMFADCWDDPAAVEQRAADLRALAGSP